MPAALKAVDSRLQGHLQLTDAYLLTLAGRRRGVLASFDRGLRMLAGDTFDSALEILTLR